MSRLVVKVGGAVAAESAGRILGLAEEGHEVIVVHGAGPQITTEMERLGIPVSFVNGRRRTSHAALDVVRGSMEAVNAELCAALGDIASFNIPLPKIDGFGVVRRIQMTFPYFRMLSAYLLQGNASANASTRASDAGSIARLR